MNAPPNAPLNRREREVLALVACGLTNAEIGERLFIAPATVRSHLVSIRKKLGSRNRAHAVIIGIRMGLIEVEGVRRG